jgi:hypothetical protein
LQSQKLINRAAIAAVAAVAVEAAARIKMISALIPSAHKHIHTRLLTSYTKSERLQQNSIGAIGTVGAIGAIGAIAASNFIE